MKNSDNKRYVYLMLSFFGAISLSIVVFFVVYRFRGIGDWVRTLTQILAPFIYGGVVAYLLRPMCNISLSIVVFFVVYRFRGIGDWVRTLTQILAPFIYGGVVAYLLRPMCNHYEAFFQKILPAKGKKLSPTLAVGLSMITGLLIVYALIIMIAPQLYHSVMGLWNSLPDKVQGF